MRNVFRYLSQFSQITRNIIRKIIRNNRDIRKDTKYLSMVAIIYRKYSPFINHSVLIIYVREIHTTPERIWLMYLAAHIWLNQPLLDIEYASKLYHNASVQFSQIHRVALCYSLEAYLMSIRGLFSQIRAARYMQPDKFWCSAPVCYLRQ